ncbi:MAG: deoxyribodipyrimidine photo-lyase [Bryobacteraceae bacterium]
MPAPVLVWFRQDLRLSDNPALVAALERRGPVIPVFIWAPEDEGEWTPGASSRWWLGRSLEALGIELAKRGSRLIIRRGPTTEALERLISETGAAAVLWNRRYEPAAVALEARLESSFRKQGLLANGFNGSLLVDPGSVRNQAGQPFRVFTPFWRAFQATFVPASGKDAPRRIASPARWPPSLEVRELGFDRAYGGANQLGEHWQPGEPGARRQLERFLREALASYPASRDLPGIEGTSRLSPHLHFGEISPSRVWLAMLGTMGTSRAGAQAFLRQLGWREFAYHILHSHPGSPREALRQEFASFPWRMDRRLLEAWTEGRTGYPLVDAGMRELRQTGWMHNRVRMVAASFLVKHLLIAWHEGAAWFWDALLDADLANNTFGWQWVAGCGADAAPYFRIFNPTVQAAKFDPDGRYVERWVPELKKGEKYPAPIVEHAAARRRALQALASFRGGSRRPAS